jgi:hypothetical protein
MEVHSRVCLPGSCYSWAEVNMVAGVEEIRVGLGSSNSASVSIQSECCIRSGMYRSPCHRYVIKLTVLLLAIFVLRMMKSHLTHDPDSLPLKNGRCRPNEVDTGIFGTATTFGVDIGFLRLR